MKTYQEYLDFLKWAEADNVCRFLPYKDSKSIWTIGYGRNIEANPFTDAEVRKCAELGGANQAFFDWLLTQDATRHMNEVMVKLPWLSHSPIEVQFFVTDLNFNMGWATLSAFSTTLSLIQNSKFKEVADHMPLTQWYTDVGRRSVKWCEILRGI